MHTNTGFIKTVKKTPQNGSNEPVKGNATNMKAKQKHSWQRNDFKRHFGE